MTDTYTYDANGNLTDRGSDEFAWDHENRMTAATVSSVASSFEYNGDGLRVSMTANSVTTDYTWDTVGSLPVVLDDGAYRYVYGLDLIATIDGSDDPAYFSYDGLGSTSDLTDGNADVTATWSYDVFGAVRASTGSSDQVFKFTGEQKDASKREAIRDSRICLMT